MSAKPTPRDEDMPYMERDRNLLLPTAEALRIAAAPPAEVKKTDEEKISVFWRVFGGAIISVAALIVMSVYQGLSGSIQELRGEISKLREQSGDFVRSADYSTRSTTMWNRLQEFNKLSADLTVATNKLAALELQLTAAEKERKELHTAVNQLTAMKDKLAAVDELRKAHESDHKEILSIGGTVQTLEKRDALLERIVKDVETERKDLAREYQQLRERIAKLEGSSESKAKEKPAEQPKPVPPRDPNEIKD